MAYNEIFDEAKFLKSNSGLKAKEFYSLMMKTSMWAKFIECRINYDNLEGELHMNFFDKLGRLKRGKK